MAPISRPQLRAHSLAAGRSVNPLAAHLLLAFSIAGCGGGGSDTAVSAAPAPTSEPVPEATAQVTPTEAELDAVAKRYDECFALPASQRVLATDAAGVATTVAGACAAPFANYKSNGRDWLGSMSGALADATLDGAKHSRPVIEYQIPPRTPSDPKETVHPYCAAGPCVVATMTRTEPADANRTSRVPTVLARVDGVWQNVGNHRPVSAEVVFFIDYQLQNNPARAASTLYGQVNRIETGLELRLDPSGPNMAGVRAARVKGPGLPAEGVVLSRSAQCGQSDRMVIVNRSGDTFVVDGGVNQPRKFTNQTQRGFKLKVDGLPSGVPWPGTTATSVDFAPEVIDPVATVAPWSEYTWELFNFDSVATTPTVPDMIFRTRLRATPSANAGSDIAAADKWPALSATALDDYLTLSGASAGAVSSASFEWINPGNGERIDVAYLFGQNFATVGGVSLSKRTLYNFATTAGNPTSATAAAIEVNLATGVSTSPFTSSISSAQNPRCAEPDRSIVALTGATGDYRSLGLAWTTPDGTLKRYGRFWN